MIPTKAYLWNENARHTVWDLDAYRARHPMPWKPEPAPKPEPPTAPLNHARADAQIPAFGVDYGSIVFASDAPVSKFALLSTQNEQLTHEINQLREERKLMKLALEIANKDNAEKEDTIRELRAGMDAIRDLVASTVPPSGRGLLVDLKTALAPRSSTAPSVQHEPGESANDSSVAQTDAKAHS